MAKPLAESGRAAASAGPQVAQSTPPLVALAHERVDRLDLGHDVEVAAVGEHELAAGQQVEVAAQAAAGPSHALGNDADLAVVERVEGQDLVGLAEVAALEDDGLGSVDPRLAHMFGIVVAGSAATQRERERVVKEPAALRAGVP